MTISSTPAHLVQPRRLWMAFILIAVIFLGTVQPLTTAHADPGYAYFWSLTFDFEESANGRLYVAVGHNDNGSVQNPPIYTETFNVPCSRVGNAGVTGGVLKLNGGYLACDLDLQRAVEAAFARCSAIEKGCHMNIEDVELYDNLHAEATVWSPIPGEAPLFYHPDASYSINPQSSTTQITAAISPHGTIPSAALPAFPILGTWQNYAASYACGGGCDIEYTTAGGMQIVNTANAKVSFYTPSTKIYIGHNPAIGTTAPAGTMIDFLLVDPANHGNH
jgi:hypothetical protein